MTTPHCTTLSVSSLSYVWFLESWTVEAVGCKAAVENGHTEETSELALRARLWKIRYSFDFGMAGPDALGMNHMPRKAYFFPPKAALFRVHHQSVVI